MYMNFINVFIIWVVFFFFLKKKEKVVMLINMMIVLVKVDDSFGVLHILNLSLFLSLSVSHRSGVNLSVGKIFFPLV